MYQKSAGQIVGPLTDDQQRSIFEVALPSEDKQLKVHASLNPDQELYWVKMGIAFENAAADETDPTKKMDYFRTALAVHQITLQMNPINGYNYNNKGRVLKAMGEAFGRQEYFQKALEHYNKAIALDENNVYFNLDKANTLLSLKRTPEAFDLIHQLTVKFPDFAVPYSYAGFIKMQTGENADAVNFFIKALKSDWKGDDGSKALAAINLGVLEGRAGRWADSETAYSVAVQANPESADSYLRLADAQAHEQHRAAAVATLQRMLQVSPNDPHALSMLKQLGASK
jgi:tetratricopeptide (TPR) repeat protein